MFLFLVLCYNTATGWQPICSWINIIIIIIIKIVVWHISSILIKCCTKTLVLQTVSPISFMRSVTWCINLAFYCHRLCSIIIKMSRKCVNNPDNVCYVCGGVTFTSRKCPITPTLWKACLFYFSCKVGNQNKNEHTLHCVFFQTQCVGETEMNGLYRLFAHGLEGA